MRFVIKFFGKNTGFTLIEFVIVSIIIAIISSALITYFKSPTENTLDLAVKKVAYDLGYARQRALNTSRTHRVYINTPDRLRIGFANYTIIQNPDDLTNFDINISKKYPGVSFFKNYSVRFDPLGRNLYKNVTSILLLHSGKSKRIRIISDTGSINVQ
ncbi:MAG: prepilin-type N-terminal cleavage/methylation domain-containing protein [Proteobacteria bacterium]|nr:prepilin-type N-terminal cleavage/methylation domain-containing protein [Pseudomonadota bacterium]